MLPSFICVGASKSGTTTLQDILSQHPQIYLPKEKETQFFVKKKLYKRGVNYYEDRYYKNVSTDNIISGEICPQYMSSQSTPKRIYNELGGKTKLIFMLRNPIERSISHYSMKTRSFENLSYDNAIMKALKVKESNLIEDNEVITRHLDFNCFDEIGKSDVEKNAFRYTRYVYPGLYSTIINDYLEYFPSENIMIILFDDFVSNIESEITKVLNFLNVDNSVSLNYNLHSNKKKLYRSKLFKRIRNSSLVIPTRGKNGIKKLVGIERYKLFVSFVDKLLTNKNKQVSLDKKTLEKLNNQYLEEIINLEKYLGVSLAGWKEELTNSRFLG